MKDFKIKRLINHSIIFAIGNLGSKLITFLMLPLYTAILSQENFGKVDLLMTTISLMTPIISLSVFEGVLRFCMDNKYKKEKIITNGLFISVVGGSFLVLLIPTMLVFKVHYASVVCIILFAQSIQMLFSYYAKSTNNLDIFAQNGIFLSVMTAVFNIIFLVFLRLGVNGYFYSMLLSLILSNIWLIYKLKIIHQLSMKFLDFYLMRELLKYSLPIIPNSIALWINNVANRYFILFFVGSYANGIFAVANKIPTLIGVLNTIFFQAWQISVIEQFDSENKEVFYAQSFYLYSNFLFLGVSGLLVILRPLISLLVNESFYSAWKYVPLLLISVLYASFSGFFGQYYIASKKTNGLFNTTIIGAFINLVFNFFLIKRFSLIGAGISSIVSFLCLWIIRIFETKKIVKTELNYKNLILNHIVLVLQITFMYMCAKNFYKLLIIEMSLFLLLVILNVRQVFSKYKRTNFEK
ncbi:hypothetical protein D7L51_14150 [Enterococcus faecalis]|nr:hypothetical protein [Enterococcus faecalis]EHZ5578715.1 polysaccharide biosynthesis C-terminal domain-containing protein [Enterococcus faecalis]